MQKVKPEVCWKILAVFSPPKPTDLPATLPRRVAFATVDRCGPMVPDTAGSGSGKPRDG